MKVDYNKVQELLEKLEFDFWRVPKTTVTICVATLDGFHVGTGSSSCIDPIEFKAEIGEEVARENALKDATNKIWELKGAQLRAQLFGNFLGD